MVLITISFISTAATDFTVTNARSQAMTFATPIVQMYHSLFIKNPADTPSYTAFLEPLHWYSWYAMLGLIVVSAPVLWLAATNQDDNEIEENEHEFTLAKSYVLCGGMISFARPWSVVPTSATGKFAFFW